jgi:hypothetical protein
MVFTREELDEMYKSNLISLGKYYSINLNMRMLKGDMIDRILEETTRSVEDDVQMSVRIRRIKESQE